MHNVSSDPTSNHSGINLNITTKISYNYSGFLKPSHTIERLNRITYKPIDLKNDVTVFRRFHKGDIKCVGLKV